MSTEDDKNKASGSGGGGGGSKGATPDEIDAQIAANQAALAELQAASEENMAATQQQMDDAASNAAEENQARADELAQEQADYEAELEAARQDQQEEQAAAAEAVAEASEDYDEEDHTGAEYDFDEKDPLEQLEADWESYGVMGALGNRHNLVNAALSSTFGKWFPPQRKFPEINFNFVVLAGMDFLGEFQSVHGIGFDVPVKTVNEGGRHHSPHLLPFDGPGKRSNLTLKWGAVSTTSLYKWIEAVRIGWNFHRTVYVIQLARDGWPTRIMRFAGAFPTSWDGADLDTEGSSWALQTLTLVYDRFNMMTLPFDMGAAIRGDAG